jgi:peroxin-12
MDELIAPAIDYILSIYAQRYPRYLLRIANRSQEIYSIIMIFIERYYLKKYNASFTESYYSFKRVPFSNENISPVKQKYLKTDLSKKQINYSVLFLVGIPYIRKKLSMLYEDLGGGISNYTEQYNFNEEEEKDLKTRIKENMKKKFLKYYPIVNMLYNLSFFIQRVCYLYDKTEYFNPWFRLIGLRIQRMTMEDYKKNNQSQDKLMDIIRSILNNTNANFAKKLLACIRVLSGRSFELLKYALPLFVLTFKFMEWWTNQVKSNSAVDQSNIPAPPEALEPHPDGLSIPDDVTKCPICRRTRTNTAVTSTGYAFCYPCIFNYIEENHRCPITLVKLNSENIRKIYLS